MLVSLLVTFQNERRANTASEPIGHLSSWSRIHDLEVREPEIKTMIRRIYEKGLLYGELQKPTHQKPPFINIG
ncbi:MAG: hypothetical protein E3J88_01995 [Anaerolineales bacterium]|nr:MAG: hypothetical protein E3J88_01995 [Anaerolineales bacterium]